MKESKIGQPDGTQPASSGRRTRRNRRRNLGGDGWQHAIQWGSGAPKSLGFRHLCAPPWDSNPQPTIYLGGKPLHSLFAEMLKNVGISMISVLMIVEEIDKM